MYSHKRIIEIIGKQGKFWGFGELKGFWQTIVIGLQVSGDSHSYWYWPKRASGRIIRPPKTTCQTLFCRILQYCWMLSSEVFYLL